MEGKKLKKRKFNFITQQSNGSPLLRKCSAKEKAISAIEADRLGKGPTRNTPRNRTSNSHCGEIVEKEKEDHTACPKRQKPPDTHL